MVEHDEGSLLLAWKTRKPAGTRATDDIVCFGVKEGSFIRNSGAGCPQKQSRDEK